jgi:hypothetical protein|tara:strand:+ start:8335 stop:8637 length:303 start_codon:yes stop_codon:yes gene_type:complete
MAQNKDLHEGVEIVFADGNKRVIKPLTIRQLRKFMKVANELKTDDEAMTDADIDRMVEAASIALAKVDPDLAGDPEGLEDILDLRCFGELMSAAMGADPN